MKKSLKIKIRWKKFMERLGLMKQLPIFVREEIDLEIPNTMMVIEGKQVLQIPFGTANKIMAEIKNINDEKFTNYIHKQFFFFRAAVTMGKINIEFYS